MAEQSSVNTTADPAYLLRKNARVDGVFSRLVAQGRYNDEGYGSLVTFKILYKCFHIAGR